MIIEQKALYQELLAMQSKNKAINIINEIDNSKNIDEKINKIIYVVTLLVDSINEIKGIINSLKSTLDDYETYRMEQNERRE